MGSIFQVVMNKECAYYDGVSLSIRLQLSVGRAARLVVWVRKFELGDRNPHQKFEAGLGHEL